jgi:hypothetical protein
MKLLRVFSDSFIVLYSRVDRSRLIFFQSILCAVRYVGWIRDKVRNNRVVVVVVVVAKPSIVFEHCESRIKLRDKNKKHCGIQKTSLLPYRTVRVTSEGSSES